MCTTANIAATASGVTGIMIGGDFSALSDGSENSSTAGGSITQMIGGRFTAWTSAYTPTYAIGGQFWEPAAFDALSGLGTPSNPTNRTAAEIRGTLSILESTVASAASITSMAVSTSFVYLTGTTATTLHGIHKDVYNKTLWLVNETGANLTIKHNSGSAAAGEVIYTATGADVVSTGNSRHLFIWSTTKNGWILMGGDL